MSHVVSILILGSSNQSGVLNEFFANARYGQDAATRAKRLQSAKDHGNLARKVSMDQELI